jgi:outer membrane protein assembly factor BamD (BamD/ComL family)
MTVAHGTSPTPQQPTPWPGEPSYDRTQASWYTKTSVEMNDAEVNEARAYYDSIGSNEMEGEWLRRHNLPDGYGDTAVNQ